MQQVKNFAAAGAWRRMEALIFLFIHVLRLQGLRHKEEESPRPDDPEDV